MPWNGVLSHDGLARIPWQMTLPACNLTYRPLRLGLPRAYVFVTAVYHLHTFHTFHIRGVLPPARCVSQERRAHEKTWGRMALAQCDSRTDAVL
jgi:hypothetical protein